MDLVILYGLPASGKLTVARELARLTGYRIFHNHLTVDLVTSVFPDFNAPHLGLRESIWLTVFEHAVRYGLPGLLFTMVFHRHGTPTPSFFPRVQELLDGGRGRLCVAELRCDLDEVKRRVVDESRRAFGKPTTPGAVEWFLANRHYEPDLSAVTDDVLRLDTTRLAPEAAAGWIAAHFRLAGAPRT